MSIHPFRQKLDDLFVYAFLSRSLRPPRTLLHAPNHYARCRVMAHWLFLRFVGEQETKTREQSFSPHRLVSSSVNGACSVFLLDLYDDFLSASRMDVRPRCSSILMDSTGNALLLPLFTLTNHVSSKQRESSTISQRVSFWLMTRQLLIYFFFGCLCFSCYGQV